jgi:glycosyltransferase involved in cell wall biosynthesis
VSEIADETEHRPSPVAYITSRFPKLSETFILNEILELERQGLAVAPYALVREKERVVHAEAVAMAQRTVFAPLASYRVIADQFHWLRTHPIRYSRAWWKALKGNLRSRGFLARALVVVPKAASFARHMEASGVRHVHAHWATHSALAGYVIKELTGLPFSFTAHAHDIHVDQTMLAEKIEGAEFVVTISDYNRHLLESISDEAVSKVRVIRCGVDTKGFAPRNPGALDRQETLTIACVASLEPRKGHRILLEAVARLRAEGLPIRLSLVGEGETRGELEAAIAMLGVGDVVTMHGGQPNRQVRKLLVDSDIYVQPSMITRTGKSEGIPVALMEAMATGLPVVATDISGVPELVDDRINGLLVPENDVNALVKALQLLCEDPGLRHELGTAARHAVEREYDLSVNVGRLRELLAPDSGTAQNVK